MTAVGDPNQAIYGWRGASVSNILNFAEFFPAGPGADGPDVLPHGQPALRHDGSSRSPTRSPQPLYAEFDQVAPLEAKDGRRATVQVHAVVHETYADELDWLAEQVIASHARDGRAALERDRRADPRQQPRCRRLRRA